MTAKWHAPPTKFYKANWDVAISTNRNCMGIGVIIRDEEGRVSAAKNKTVQGSNEPVTGEAMVALHATKLCWDLGFFEVVLEGDSLSVVKAIGETSQN